MDEHQASQWVEGLYLQNHLDQIGPEQQDASHDARLFLYF